MDTLRRYLDLSVDFLAFVAGMAVLFSGLHSMNRTEAAKFAGLSGNSGLKSLEASFDDKLSGEEVLALLLAPSPYTAEVNGTLVIPGSAEAAACIDVDKEYRIIREYDKDMQTLKLIFTEYGGAV